MKLFELVSSRKSELIKRLFSYLFVIWCALILWITLFSRVPSDHRVFRSDLLYEFKKLLIDPIDGVYYVKLFLENILLFVPLGFLSPWKKWWTVLVTGCLFSIFIESVQYVSMLGECEIDDIIANTLGALLGFFLFKIFISICAKIEGRK